MHNRSLEVSPCPSLAPVIASLALPKPSSRHTTLANTRFQLSSQTVPHSPFFSTSTRPSPVLAPPFSLTKGCWKTQKGCYHRRPCLTDLIHSILQGSCGAKSNNITLRHLNHHVMQKANGRSLSVKAYGMCRQMFLTGRKERVVLVLCSFSAWI